MWKNGQLNKVNSCWNSDIRLDRWIPDVAGSGPGIQCAKYCKTLYFHCILISRFWNVEILLHFNLAFSQCSTSIYQAFGRQTEFSRVFNFAILSYSRNLRKFDAREKYMFYSILYITTHCQDHVIH